MSHSGSVSGQVLGVIVLHLLLQCHSSMPARSLPLTRAWHTQSRSPLQLCIVTWDRPGQYNVLASLLTQFLRSTGERPLAFAWRLTPFDQQHLYIALLAYAVAVRGTNNVACTKDHLRTALCRPQNHYAYAYPGLRGIATISGCTAAVQSYAPGRQHAATAHRAGMFQHVAQRRLCASVLDAQALVGGSPRGLTEST